MFYNFYKFKINFSREFMLCVNVCKIYERYIYLTIAYMYKVIHSLFANNLAHIDNDECDRATSSRKTMGGVLYRTTKKLSVRGKKRRSTVHKWNVVDLLSTLQITLAP